MAGKRGNPNWKKGIPSPNPTGMSAEVAKQREALKVALADDGPRIHAALMRLVDADNPQAIIYAHQRVFGKPPAAPEDRAQEDAMVEKLSDAIKRRDTDGLLTAYAVLTREKT